MLPGKYTHILASHSIYTVYTISLYFFFAFLSHFILRQYFSFYLFRSSDTWQDIQPVFLLVGVLCSAHNIKSSFVLSMEHSSQWRIEREPKQRVYLHNLHKCKITDSGCCQPPSKIVVGIYSITNIMAKWDSYYSGVVRGLFGFFGLAVAKNVHVFVCVCTLCC